MKKITNIESTPEILESLGEIQKEGEIFINKSLAISHRIYEYIITNKWTQKILAEKMKKTEAEISKLLSGTHNYTLRMLSKIEAVLDIDIIIVPHLKL